jgi:hypothetical protein
MPTETQDRPTIGEIQSRIIHLKDLLKAADQLCGVVPDSLAPMFAVLQASLSEARVLDGRMQDLVDAEEAA